MERVEELIEYGLENKERSADDGYGEEFDEIIRTKCWHKASETIPYESCCIVITKDNAIKLMCFNKRFNSFFGTNDEEPYENIDKWCYATDILPSDDAIKFNYLNGIRK